MNMNIDKLSVLKKKKNIYILDGIIKYQIQFNENNITCCCDKFNHVTLCKHIQFYLSFKGFDLLLMKHWTKIKSIVISQVNKDVSINNSIIVEFIQNNILNAECGLCLNKINDPSYNICKICSNISHVKCAEKWNNLKKGCMYCRE
jgi:hypothetical protein